MQPRSRRVRAVSTLAVACTLITGLIAPTPAFGQERLEDIVSYEPPENATLSAANWEDPAITFGLDPATLVPAPDFDFGEVRQSTILAAGIEDIAVDDDIVGPYEARYLRVVQVRDTLIRNIEQAEDEITSTERAIARTENEIVQSQDEADRVNVLVQAELDEEERLTNEIFARNRAIAEFAIRAFTGEDQLELILDEPDTASSKTRVVTAEVSEDLRFQISEREGEHATHLEQRLILEDDLAVIEDEIQTLENDIDSFEADIVELEDNISALDEFIEENERIAEETADSYELALHTRLTGFVAGTDLPYVALNAYLAAARTLETEDPQCQIHWSQLAGIGRIESFHGYFGDSTLDVDGHTTEDILGLPLDGRILSGGEFVTEGDEVPEATGRTEEQTLPAAEAAPAAPAAPAAETGPAPADGEAPAEGAAAPTAEGEAAPAAAPAPVRVIKTLALILDSDDGVLDGDTVYDRAVGPMQFIPTTWRLFDADGNGDGKTEPQNIYDAALASARYLCSSTSTMTTTAGEQRAYFAYNHDLDYSNNVTNEGRGYRAEITIESPEILENSGRYYLGISEGAAAENERLPESELEGTNSSEADEASE